MIRKKLSTNMVGDLSEEIFTSAHSWSNYLLWKNLESFFMEPHVTCHQLLKGNGWRWFR